MVNSSTGRKRKGPRKKTRQKVSKTFFDISRHDIFLTQKKETIIVKYIFRPFLADSEFSGALG